MDRDGLRDGLPRCARARLFVDLAVAGDDSHGLRRAVAPIRHALPAAIVVGLLLDFGDLVRTPGAEPVVVLGRHAIGCLLASYTVVTLRGMMFRRNVVTIVVLAGVTMALTQIVAIAMLKFRSLYDVIIVDDAAAQLGSQLGSAIYTAALAFIVGPLLNRMKWLFGFTGSARSSFRMP
ncbi:MAG: hypothetical protein ACFHWZ_10120 [Phycisphaerales bacterium]